MYSNFQEKVAALVKKAAEANTDKKSAAITLKQIGTAGLWFGSDDNIYALNCDVIGANNHFAYYMDITCNSTTILRYNEFSGEYYISDHFTPQLLQAFKKVVIGNVIFSKVFGI